MAEFTDVSKRNVLESLYKGENYRDEVTLLIQDEFLNYTMDFTHRMKVSEQKVDQPAINMLEDKGYIKEGYIYGYYVPFLNLEGHGGYLLGHIYDADEDDITPMFWVREDETLEKLPSTDEIDRNKALVKIDELYETVKTVESEELVEELREIIEKE